MNISPAILLLQSFVLYELIESKLTLRQYLATD